MRSHDTPVASGVRIPEIVAQILGVELGKILSGYCGFEAGPAEIFWWRANLVQTVNRFWRMCKGAWPKELDHIMKRLLRAAVRAC
jgi:hypothetical protein